MSKSKLATLKIHSPNHSGKRLNAIDTITPHCVVGQLSARNIAFCFPKGRNASCNYGIGKDGEVIEIVPEEYRSWCSSSSANDQRAVTIECASDPTSPYRFNRAVYDKLVELCADIVKRNGRQKLVWKGYQGYEPKTYEMVLTVHRWFANKSCPGDWLYSRMNKLAEDVNDKLGASEMYRVRKSWGDVKSQIGAFRILANAQSVAHLNPGYRIYNNAGQEVGKVLEKTDTMIANEVIKGKWGNGKERKERLKKAGYDYTKIQKLVNAKLKKG